jgi:hypothetical protein
VITFVEHVGHAGLDLGVDDGEPKLLGLDDSAVLVGSNVLVVEVNKLLTPDTVEAGALARAEQVPVAILLDSLHEQVRDPETQEQVTGTKLLVTCVLAKIQELEHIRVPRFQVPIE